MSSLLWFVAIVAAIPLALWLLKRTPMGGTAAGGLMRTVATLSLAPNQRVVTVEVGSGAQRRWLVLGVTAQQITALHTLEPHGEAPAPAAPVPPFSQLLQRLQARDAGDRRAR